MRLALVGTVLCGLGAYAQQNATQKFGGKFDTLHTRQQRLIVEWAHHRAEVTGEAMPPDRLYDSAPESVRTTFQAVTHALLHTPLEIKSDDGAERSAFSLVRSVEEVLGARDDSGGDRQYRIYATLQPKAVELLRQSENFSEGHNGVFHHGFPLSFRTPGTPSVQFSVSEDGRRSDIDVDYHSSAPLKALFNGHLSSHNSDVRPSGNYSSHVGRWEGLLAWWRGLLGPQEKTHDSYGTEVDPTLLGESPLPKAARGEIEDAIDDFLRSWLMEGRIAAAEAYFDERVHPCVHLPGGELAPNHRTARLELYRELRAAASGVGSVASIDEVVAPLEPWRDGPEIQIQKVSGPYTLFSAESALLEEIDCARASHPGGYYETESQEDFYEDAFGSALVIGKTSGEKLPIHAIWQKRRGAWRIIGFTSGDVAKNHRLSRHQEAPAAGAVSIKIIPGDQEQIAAAKSFFENWLIDRDYEAALAAVDPVTYACWSSDMQATDVTDLLKSVAETTGSQSELSSVLVAVRPPWYLEHGVAKHENDKIFDVVTGPAEIVSQHFGCGKPVAESDRTYVTVTQFIGPRTGHSALLLRWAKTDDAWRIVAMRVETH